MAQNQLQIINRAANLLGKANFVSLADTSPLLSSMLERYNQIVPDIITQGNWRFASKIQQLNLLVNVPIPPQYWQAIYEIPADYLAMRRLYPNVTIWEIYENRHIYTQQQFSEGLWAEYTFIPDVSRWPDTFCTVISYTIASELALSNAQSTEFAGYLDKKANEKYALAIHNDNQSRPNPPMQRNPLLNARFAGVNGGAV